MQFPGWAASLQDQPCCPALPLCAEEAQLLLQVEPEMVGDLVALVQAEQGVPQDLRALAVRTLAVQMPDRNRGAAIVAAVSSRTHGGVLSMLDRKSVV